MGLCCKWRLDVLSPFLLFPLSIFLPPFPDSLYLSVHLSTPSAPPSALPHPLVVKSIPLTSRSLTPFLSRSFVYPSRTRLVVFFFFTPTASPLLR